MSTGVFFIMVFSTIVLYFMLVVLFLLTGGYTVEPKQVLKDVLKGTKVVLTSIFTILYVLASIALLVIAICVDKIQGTSNASKHTIEVSAFGRTYVLSSKT